MLHSFFITALFYFIFAIILGIFLTFNPSNKLTFIHSHMMLIGFVSSVIIATMYKQVPVLTSSNIFSEKMVKLSFYLLNIGILTFIFKPIYGMPLILFSLYIYTINIILTIIKAKVKPHIIKYYGLSAILLTLGASLGGLKLIYGFDTFLHSHLALLGGVVFIIVGAMSFMLPMVLVKEVYSKKLVDIVFYIFIIGLFGLLITKNYIFGIIIYVALLIFFYNMIKTHVMETKTKVESVEAKYFITALIYMVAGIPLGILLLLNSFTNISLHAHILLLGFVIQTIIGGMYHIIPTLTYVELMKKGVVIKSFKELYSERLSKFIYIFFNISLLVFLFGLYFNNILKILGAIATGVILIVFSIEMLRILTRLWVWSGKKRQ